MASMLTIHLAAGKTWLSYYIVLLNPSQPELNVTGIKNCNQCMQKEFVVVAAAFVVMVSCQFMLNSTTWFSGKREWNRLAGDGPPPPSGSEVVAVVPWSTVCAPTSLPGPQPGSPDHRTGKVGVFFSGSIWIDPIVE